MSYISSKSFALKSNYYATISSQAYTTFTSNLFRFRIKPFNVNTNFKLLLNYPWYFLISFLNLPLLLTWMCCIGELCHSSLEWIIMYHYLIETYSTPSIFTTKVKVYFVGSNIDLWIIYVQFSRYTIIHVSSSYCRIMWFLYNPPCVFKISHDVGKIFSTESI